MFPSRGSSHAAHTSVDDREPPRPGASGRQGPGEWVIEVSQLDGAQAGDAGVVVGALHDPVPGRGAVARGPGARSAAASGAASATAPTKRVEVGDLGGGHEERGGRRRRTDAASCGGRGGVGRAGSYHEC